MIIGMGVPTSASYVIGASIGAPILIKLGVRDLAAHMFVLYFATFADVIPPVAIASYAAAAIARADPMHTGAQAFRLAMGGFIVGFSRCACHPASEIRPDRFEFLVTESEHQCQLVAVPRFREVVQPVDRHR